MDVHPVDMHVGGRVRLARAMAGQKGLSRSKVAEQMGITHQQIEKYESGQSRVAASRLWELSQILQVPVGFFFEGLSGDLTETPSPIPDLEPEAIHAGKIFAALTDKQRAAVLLVMKEFLRLEEELPDQEVTVTIMESDEH